MRPVTPAPGFMETRTVDQDWLVEIGSLDRIATVDQSHAPPCCASERGTLRRIPGLGAQAPSLRHK